jgi:N utilization substance protein B
MAQSKRYAARRLVLQALYQCQLNERELDELLAQFRLDQGYPGVDADYFEALLGDAYAARTELDVYIEEYGNIPAAQLDPVEHAALWVGLTELRDRSDVPTRVILNEAIELTKQFGAEGGHRYVNGVLDRAISKLRPSTG